MNGLKKGICSYNILLSLEATKDLLVFNSDFNYQFPPGVIVRFFFLLGA